MSNWINRRHPLVYVHVPKSGGNSMRQWLQQLEPNQWSKIPQAVREGSAATTALQSGATVFTLVRHPLPRLASGYRMFVEYRNFEPDWDWITQHLLHPMTMIKSVHACAQFDPRHSGVLIDWYWHHQSQTAHGAQHTQWFRWEELEQFADWISAWIPSAKTIPIPVDNESDKRIPIVCPRKYVDSVNAFLKTDCDTFGYPMQDLESMIQIV